MGTGEIIGTGSRGQVAYNEETTYGTLVAPDTRIDFTSESVQGNVGDLVSDALNPMRGISKRTLGNVDVGGDINVEQNTEGFGTLYKHALGTSVTIPTCDGGIRTYASQGYHDATDYLGCETMLDSDGNNKFTATGTIAIAYLDSDYQLGYFTETYISRDDEGFTLAGNLDQNVSQGNFVFQSNAAWSGVYTHVIYAARELPVGLSFEINRDVAYFWYTGCRINQLEETFNNGEIITATFSILGREEYYGANLEIDAAIDDDHVIFETPADMFFNTNGGEVGIGAEHNVAFTGIIPGTYGSTDSTLIGVPTGGSATSIINSHSSGEPVVSETTLAASTLTVPDPDPLSSYEAALYLEEVATEVLSCSYTFNNNLFADKFQLGDRYRVRLPEQQRNVTGTMNIELDDLVLYHYYREGTSRRLEIRAVVASDEGEIGSTGVYRQKHVIMPKVEWTGQTPNIAGPEVIRVDMPFVSLYDETWNTPELVVILVNSVTTI